MSSPKMNFSTPPELAALEGMLSGLRPGATEPADSALLTKIHNGTC